MKDFKLKYISKKAKLLLASGMLTMTLALAGCGEKDTDTATATDATATETEAETEAQTEAATEAQAIDTNEKEYAVIDGMEEDIVEFAEANLPNGFGSIEITEDNKLDVAKRYVDSYIAMNLSSNEGQITPATLAVLNQNNILIPTEMKDNYKNFEAEIGKYMRIVEPDTMIDFEVLVQEQDDAKFLNDLETEIAYMNVATTSTERQERISNIVEMIESIDPSTTTYSSSTIYTAVNMVIRADGMAKAYGSQIFADNEAVEQFYTTIDDAICIEAEDEGYELSVNETVFASATSYESMFFTSVADKLEYAIDLSNENVYNSYYSYEKVTERVADNLLNKFKAPELDSIAKENAVREAASNENTKNVGTTTTTNVPESQVPEQYREKTTEKSDYSDGQTTEGADKVKPASESSDVYTKAKGEGYTAGSIAAENAHRTNYAGHATDMPVKSLGTKPADGSTNYNDVYNYYYNVGWNETRSGYIADEAAATKENQEATTTYEPVENGTEEKYEETTETYTTEKTTEKTTESNTTTYYVPVENGTEEKYEETVETLDPEAKVLYKKSYISA